MELELELIACELHRVHLRQLEGKETYERSRSVFWTWGTPRWARGASTQPEEANVVGLLSGLDCPCCPNSAAEDKSTK